MAISKNNRVRAAIIGTCCLLVVQYSSVLADAKIDGDKGIEEFRNGNLIEAMQLLEKSAAQGYTPAQVTLAYILDYSEQDTEAYQWYQQAADSGDPAGLFGLGSMYAKGEGTPLDPQKAGQLIEQSALLDHRPAMRAYANALEHGKLGFSQNHSSAAEWFLKAANAGDYVSMHRLIDAYSLGELGLAVNPEEASKWEIKLNPKN